MIKIKYYNRKSKKMEWRAELTLGEKYDLIKRNQEMMKRPTIKSTKEVTADEWENLLDATVQYADRDYPIQTSEEHEFELDELTIL